MPPITILKRKHSLVGKRVIPLIRKMGQTPSGPMARMKSTLPIDEMSATELSQAVKEITGETDKELLAMAGKEFTVENAQVLLHWAIVLANEFGQPGQVLVAAQPAAGTSFSLHMPDGSDVEEEVQQPRTKKQKKELIERIDKLEKEREDSVAEVKEKVCSFLESRNVSHTTVDFFRKNKIDGQVISFLTEKNLMEYGLTTIGDRVTLIEKCKVAMKNSYPDRPTCTKEKTQKNRRKELLALLRNSSQDTTCSSTKFMGRPKASLRTVTLGLRISMPSSDESGEDRKSSIVKSPLGEKNTITLKLPVDGDYSEILNISKNGLFPNGVNPVIGEVSDYHSELVNSRNVNIQTDVVPFSLREYIKTKMIPGTPKLFLLCSELPDGEELNKPVFHDETNEHEPLLEEQTNEEPVVIDYVTDLPILNLTEEIFEATSPSREVLFRISPQPMIPDVISDGINQDINEIVETCIAEVNVKNISDPVEIVRIFQEMIVKGRPLEISDESTTLEGETNFILINRLDLLNTTFSEIRSITDLRTTLEVQFYGEVAQDLGGPRKEFFTLVLQNIKDSFFDPVKEWSHDYDVIGKIFALSILQNGKLPKILQPDLLEEIFSEQATSKSFVKQLRVGLNALGLYKLTCKVPALLHLFTPTGTQPLTLKLITHILQPVFSPEGSNIRREESSMYAMFVKYLRESASGRRGNIDLCSILKFVCACEEEPLLGFRIPPSIHFKRECGVFPTANTCINKLTLPLYDSTPNSEVIYERFDYAFSNSYFGMM